MLTMVKIINYLFSLTNCFLEEQKSYNFGLRNFVNLDLEIDFCNAFARQMNAQNSKILDANGYIPKQCSLFGKDPIISKLVKPLSNKICFDLNSLMLF